MRWSYGDLISLPRDVYHELVDWLASESSDGEPTIDMDKVLP